MKNKQLLTAFLLLAAQQVLFLAFFPPFTEPDSGGYMDMALGLLSSGAFPGDLRLPGYPALLAFFYKVFGQANLPVIIFQHALGLVVWLLFMKILETDRQKLVFSALYFCDLLYNSYQHVVLADFFFSFLLCLSAWLAWLYRREGKPVFLFLCGLALGLGILTKPVLKYFPFFILPVFLADRRPLRSRLASAAVFLAAPLLVVNLWSFRNYLDEGRFTLLPLGSYHYIGRAVNFMEFPENSVTKAYFLKHVAAAPLPRNRKATAVHAAVEDMRAAGLDFAKLGPEFSSIVRLSITRHPFLYLKESGIELFYFFFSAHNLYAKNGLKGSLPYSAEQGIRSGNIAGTALKVAVSLHPFYWAVFLLFIYFITTNAGRILHERDFVVIFLFGLIAYISLVSSMANEGLARYRCAIQPFLLFFAALALDRLIPPVAAVKRKDGQA